MKLPRLPKAAVAHGHYQHMYLGSLYTAVQVKKYAQKCVDEALKARDAHDKPEPTPVPQSRD